MAGYQNASCSLGSVLGINTHGRQGEQGGIGRGRVQLPWGPIKVIVLDLFNDRAWIDMFFFSIKIKYIMNSYIAPLIQIQRCWVLFNLLIFNLYLCTLILKNLVPNFINILHETASRILTPRLSLIQLLKRVKVFLDLPQESIPGEIQTNYCT